MSGTRGAWLGVDVGTQSVKAMILSSDGEALGRGSYPLQSIRTGAEHEQDPSAWFTATRQAAAAALADAARRGVACAIGGVSLCSTSGTVTTVDRRGRPTGPGLMYDDARAARLTDEVRAANPDLWQRQGFDIQPSWALPKIVWLVRAGLPPATARIVHQTDAVFGDICGGLVDTDWSSALKSGVDLWAGDWSPRVLSSLDIDGGLLPPVRAPGSRLGAVGADWAQATGVAPGTPVLAGCTDGCAAQLGAGAVRAGDWHSVIGTTLIVKGVSREPLASPAGVVYSHRAPEGSTWLPGGASSAGAGILSRILPGAELGALEGSVHAALSGGARAPRPVIYPLVGSGERFPFASRHARALLIDQAGRHDIDAVRGLPSVEVLGAVYLGVAAVERLAFERLESLGADTSGRLSTSGGTTRSHTWTRLRATMLQRPIVMARHPEPAAGSAVLAAWGAHGGEVTLRTVAARMTGSAEAIDPEPAWEAGAHDGYGLLSDALRAEGWMAP